MPFDLEHRRLTFYTLNNKDKAVVRKKDQKYYLGYSDECNRKWS